MFDKITNSSPRSKHFLRFHYPAVLKIWSLVFTILLSFLPYTVPITRDFKNLAPMFCIRIQLPALTFIWFTNSKSRISSPLSLSPIWHGLINYKQPLLLPLIQQTPPSLPSVCVYSIGFGREPLGMSVRQLWVFVFPCYNWRSHLGRYWSRKPSISTLRKI